LIGGNFFVHASPIEAMTCELAQPSFTIVVKNTFLEVVEDEPKTRKQGIRRRSYGDIIEVDTVDGGETSDSTSLTGGLTDGDDSFSFDDFGMSPTVIAPPTTTWSPSEGNSDSTSDAPQQQQQQQEYPNHHSSPAAAQCCTAAKWPQQQGTMAPHTPAASVRPSVPQAAPPSPVLTAFCLSTSPKANKVKVPQVYAVPSACARMPSKSLPPQAPVEETRTTVMVRNLPINMNRSAFMMLLDYEGFKACYDFAYMPVDFSSGGGLGYGFVNFLTTAHATRCFQHFEGFVLPTVWGGANVASVSCSWSDPHQGLQQHVERYRSSPVMHASIPDEWKPIILSNGCRVPFPPPIKHIKAPKHNKLRGPMRAAAVQAAAASAATGSRQ